MAVYRPEDDDKDCGVGELCVIGLLVILCGYALSVCFFC